METNTNFTPAQAAALAQTSGSVSFGPLTIQYNINIPGLSVQATISLAGVTIGNINLNPQNPTMTLGGSVGFAKAEVTLTLNIPAKEVDYTIDVEVFGHTIYNGSGKLFSWGSLRTAADAVPNVSADDIKRMLASKGITDLDTLANYTVNAAKNRSTPNVSLDWGPLSPQMIFVYL